MAARYAQIVVDVPVRRVDKYYDYLIPDRLEARVEPGSRVLVPFGARSVEGFVVSRSAQPAVENVREIIDCVTDAPGVPRELLQVAEWMVDTYVCLLIEALRAMVPSGTRVESSVIVRLVGSEDDARRAKIDGAVRRVFDYLAECGGSAARDEIARALEVTTVSRHVAALARAGLVEVDTEWERPKVRARRVRAFQVAPSAGDPGAVARRLAGSSPAQAAIMQVFASAPLSSAALREAGGNLDDADTGAGGVAIPRAELLQRAGCSASALDALVRAGLLHPTEVIASRSPMEGLSSGSALAPTLAPGHKLTADQERAVERVSARIDSDGGVVVLHGVTSSGKTEVYLRAFEHALARGRRGILLVPDIALTPQMVDRVVSRFGPERVAVLHSALGAGERLDEWERARRGQVDIVVGARSAVFAPVPSLGLIVVDEEHDGSYKQDDSPRYHARDVAVFRAARAGATVVLGSATPSLETYSKAESGEYDVIELPSRIDDRPMPDVDVVDMRSELKAGNRTVFSRLLRARMEQTLDRGQQAILFMNRRGFSTFVLCRECGHVMTCPHCDVSLTLHGSQTRRSELVCHYCNYVERAPDVCPSCGGTHIRYFGAGTERIEDEVRKSFPEARVARMDVDTTRRKGAHRAILGAFREGRTDILVGTQMIAKGLDFPNVTLVGVVSADTALNLPDFRAAERTYQLISQVAGRSGRGDAPGTVVVQTYSPEHYSILAAASHDYRAFYEAEIASRREAGYPPARQMARILLRGIDESATARHAGVIAAACRELGCVSDGTVEVLGPAPAPIPRIAGKYRWHLLLLSGNPQALREAAKAGCAARGPGGSGPITVSLDIEPSAVL
ncbi:MAG TPA: primosomal protein N' [Bacillota bacterium]|nr:primosomal protein N' [Bacillota bacterium]